uniref:Ovule protein n=1 Tax=Romanomermis culicivorax TaxID=13658 RepID=A0A915JLB7_ROMCU
MKNLFKECPVLHSDPSKDKNFFPLSALREYKSNVCLKSINRKTTRVIQMPFAALEKMLSTIIWYILVWLTSRDSYHLNT